MVKGELQRLRDHAGLMEDISEARLEALKAAYEALLLVMEGSARIPESRKVVVRATLHKIDLAIRGMKEGIAPGTGKMVEVAIGTPRSCDPTSELYWSM